MYSRFLHCLKSDYFNELSPEKTQDVINQITKAYAGIGIVPGRKKELLRDYNSLFPLPPQVYVTGVFKPMFRPGFRPGND